MRRRPHGQFQRGAGGAVPEPWRGRGAAGRGAGAVARNHAGRGSEGGGAARAAARPSARVARAEWEVACTRDHGDPMKRAKISFCPFFVATHFLPSYLT